MLHFEIYSGSNIYKKTLTYLDGKCWMILLVVSYTSSLPFIYEIRKHYRKPTLTRNRKAECMYESLGDSEYRPCKNIKFL